MLKSKPMLFNLVALMTAAFSVTVAEANLTVAALTQRLSQLHRYRNQLRVLEPLVKDNRITIFHYPRTVSAKPTLMVLQPSTVSLKSEPTMAAPDMESPFSPREVCDFSQPSPEAEEEIACTRIKAREADTASAVWILLGTGALMLEQKLSSLTFLSYFLAYGDHSNFINEKKILKQLEQSAQEWSPLRLSKMLEKVAVSPAGSTHILMTSDAAYTSVVDHYRDMPEYLSLVNTEVLQGILKETEAQLKTIRIELLRLARSSNLPKELK
jgi:hypothetical protein